MLPVGYTQVEYIQNEGTGSYLNTGITAGAATTTIYDGMVIRGDTALYGSRRTSTTNRYAVQYIGSNVYRLSYYNTEQLLDTSYTAGVRHVFRQVDNVLYVDDVLAASVATTLTTGEIIYAIGALNTNGSATNLGIARMYSMQIHQNDELVLSFVPCINAEGTIGAYDEVTQTFFSNAGADGFIAGPIVSVPVEAITLTEDVIPLSRGDTYQLSWAISPAQATDKSVTFTSIDETICTVDANGFISAVGGGRAQIHVTSVSTPAVSVICYIAVEIRVESVTLEQHELQLSVGDTYTIPVTILPIDSNNKKLIWECWEWENPCITIDAETGLITAIADGEDTVYVSADSNIEAHDQCAVRVWTDVTTVACTPTEIELGLTDTAELIYYVLPDNASNKEVTITIDKPEILSYEEGIITPAAAGIATITIASVSNPECVATCVVMVFDNRESTEAEYNATSRIIQMRADIYFDGLSSVPVSISRDNYLIDADLLEEATSDDDTPFGGVTANELDLTLLNQNGMFSPTNPSSPYYGKIKKGVPIHMFCKPTDKVYVEWDELGWFYVKDWTATITGIQATVSASDRMYDIFSKPNVKVPVLKGISFAEAYQAFFDTLNEPAHIDQNLITVMPYFYNILSNKNFLAALSTGAQAYTFCGRDGIPVVKYSRGVKEIAHVLTDNDQIISVSSKQSSNLEYDGAEVILNEPQESDVTTILNVKNIIVPAEGYESALTTISNKPLYKLVAANTTGAMETRITNVMATCVDLLYIIQNTIGEDIVTTLTILGTYLETISTTFADEGEDLLSIDNTYIQTLEYAEQFKRFLRAYIFNRVPVLELETRGNIKYKLGEKVQIISERYSIDFCGVLISQQFHYDGGLSSSIKILNSEILEVI